MAIEVKCGSCGKSFRAKDELAGKAVRCPGCQQPLKIPGHGASPAAVGASKSTATKSAPAAQSSVDAAIAKVEAARKKREAEAAAAAATKNSAEVSEVAKLVEEFDKVSPKAKEKEAAAGKKPPGTPEKKLGEKPQTVTAIDVAADRVGMLKSTLVWKYALLLLFLVGGGWGSAILIQKIMHGTKKVTTVQKLDWQGIDKAYTDAEAAANAGDWDRVKELLADVERSHEVRPYKNNLRYVALRKRLETAMSGS